MKKEMEIRNILNGRNNEPEKKDNTLSVLSTIAVLILLVLKLTGIIEIGWLWVFVPVWGGMLLFVVWLVFHALNDK